MQKQSVFMFALKNILDPQADLGQHSLSKITGKCNVWESIVLSAQCEQINSHKCCNAYTNNIRLQHHDGAQLVPTIQKS